MPLPLMTALAPVAALSVNVAVQIAGSRYLKTVPFLKTLYLGFASGLFSLLAITLALLAGRDAPVAESAGLLAANVISYGALGFCYFNFVNMGSTARRIRLMLEMSNSDSPMTYQDILERYSASEMVEKRVKRLIEAGQVKVVGGRFFRKPSAFLFITRAILFMKWLVLGKTSEFD